MPNFATRHANVRMQQRAIRRDAVELLLDYGSTRRSRGADTVFFDHVARHRLAQDFGAAALRQFERFMNICAIIGDDGSLLTVFWRTRRHRHA